MVGEYAKSMETEKRLDIDPAKMGSRRWTKSSQSNGMPD